jgi:enoyl-CoA hydratase
MRAIRKRPSINGADSSHMAKASKAVKARRPDGGTGARAAASRSAGGRGAVEIAIEGGCAVATLRRPAARNRVTAAMAGELMDLAETVEDDDSICALAVTGEGSVFCAGFDEDVDPRFVETLALISKPTVAIINGDALDEGLELAIALDLRVAMAGGRFGLSQLQRDALPHFGGTQRLPRLIGATAALQMILTGAPIRGDEAMRLGLLTYLAPDRKGLVRVARELLETIATRGPLGVRMVKDAVRKGVDMTIDQGIRLEEDLYALLQTTTDRAEGVRAFLQKRKPLFKGA